MACRYYDDILVAKLRHWIPDNSKLRVLKPEESKRLFELTAEDGGDKPFKLPLIALSRSNDINLLSSIKQPKSFDGLHLTKRTSYADIDAALREATLEKGEPLTEAEIKQIKSRGDISLQFNVIPIKLEYQLDIYTKTYDEGDEYVRNFLFKLINNPVLKIDIPYNDTHIEHIANIKVLENVSDTSSISERIFSGQFTRWSIQLEIQDAFLFSVPYKNNWKLYLNEWTLATEKDYEPLLADEASSLELAKELNTTRADDQIEQLEFNFKKVK